MNDVSASAHPAAVAAPYRRYLWVAIALVLLLAVWGILSRLMARSALAREAHAVATPTVLTTKPHRGPAADTLVLPGSVQAYYEAPIYARTSGYLKAWHTDIGAPVKKGELLAEIETPEVDQQLRQAEADLGTARANYELARTTNERWMGLLATESVSQQDADQRAGDAAAKAAAQASAAANLARLRELEGFKRVVAPFEGVVTQRNTDVGALINAGQTSGSALFRVADTHRLRIYVQVPQAYAAEVRTGMNASLEFTDHPGQHYAATVTSTAHALDATSRTLQVELQIDNTGGELLPGAYAQVTFSLTPSAGNLRVPVNAVIFRGKSPQVATVDDAHRVRLRDIAAGRDFGTEVEVLAGIGPNDTVILNPPDSIADGSEVRIQPPQPQPGSGGAPAEHS
ncbi:MAG TPA: efflux RND transporter periplasmic adaptor subunit [Steroidobacteraceae bacterium]|jgi:RND family efflux transporter MFP subunit|nr:efflux RND transporter periplasmic adaptor subunit [Steroidobacteraceae bacterium]